MTQEFKPYANEADVMRIGDLEIENPVDRVTFTGDLVLTKDKAGMALWPKNCNRSSGVSSRHWRRISCCRRR